MEITHGTKTLTPSMVHNLTNRHFKNMNRQKSCYDLTNPDELKAHRVMIRTIGNNLAGREFRTFEIDDNNRQVMFFLLYYFHGCPLACEVFPGSGYTTFKNLLLVGNAGSGKTMILEVFAEYLKLLGMNTAFHNISITQLMNYYKINGHIDRYTYNEEGANKMFEGNPVHVCLNDIGLETEEQKSYGTSLTSVIDEFLYARYEIYQNRMIHCHLTSNLNIAQFETRFKYRLLDRFKSYNVIPLTGDSRRK